MGVIDAPQEVEREKLSIPDCLAELYHHFKRVKFGKALGDEVITLVPRSQLQYAEIESYNKMLIKPLNHNEVEIIMDLDAIFETREVDNG